MTTYDLKITGGTIIDGTGAPRRSGDLGIKDGRIVDVGQCSGSATETVDADGALITPGFVDVHTHYDGQVSWDPDLAPSSIHGVTTCVMGSCGVGFAPCRPDDRQRLIELMEGVEDIPGVALAEGLTWNWETLPEYMDAIDSFPHAIDFAVQVTHDALRVYVMGERAAPGAIATDDDIEQMRRLTREALEAGAVGFSTGRTDNHRTAQGDATPASEATIPELAGIARAFEGLGHGVLQAVSDFDMDPERFDEEWSVLERMLDAADGHAMSISLMQRDQAHDQWTRIIESAERVNAAGKTLRLQVAPRPIGVLLGLGATFHPFMGFPAYREIAARPLAERVATMKDPAFKAKLLSQKHTRLSGDGSSIPPLADLLLERIDMVAMRLYRLGETPNYEPDPMTCLGVEASSKKISVLECIYDALLEDDGKSLLYFPLYNFTKMNLDDVRTMLTHPLALPGLSDGGAHVGTVCDASFPTTLLSHWGRDRDEGRIELETLVRMQTHDTSRFIGLTDRGTLEPGARADVNIIDFDNLRLGAPRLIHDLPAGGARLMQNATGYVATYVRGVKVAEGGALTGNRPGRLVRVGR
ncbi:MAG: N-acyl-D-amino-acid deacylase family protein [Nannocystaceae bacterium]|nr:amidohydrolase family protein [bacterium]